MAAHLKHLSPWVKGYLIPGSTGDGWEMTPEEIRQLLDLAIQQAAAQKFHLLIGVLKTDASEARQTVIDTMSWLRSLAGTDDDDAALSKTRVRGFTVCPPCGNDLSQEQIRAGLAGILETGLPIALYQLPQVTKNTMNPELVAGLAEKFSNFILFKDTSGEDEVALSEENLGGVFMVRGAEHDYARWLREAGGLYDGFLLSTANCFGKELHQIILESKSRRLDAARQLSYRVSNAVRGIFAAVQSVPQGNAFANANKAADHFFALGPSATYTLPPRLHAGERLPVEVLRAVSDVLVRHSFMPARGYLE
jgi:dihydrodipicolinate synthase/N-acetylneuraminate lyase